MNEPIAIIGIGCRFPGGANNPDRFWQLLVDGANTITEIPRDRFDVDSFFDSAPATPGRIMSRWGGYLDQIDRFDAAFFGIAPREAERLDPQQRLLLEVAWEAFEDAGKLPSTTAVQQTGVFVGMWINDFEARMFKDPANVDFYTTLGTGRYSASGRLSYVLGLQGPSITVDTACSSSLVSVHLACQSLRNGECEMALAGGVNVILQPHITIGYSQSKMMAPDGQCKFGDEKANGYVRSEGAGIVLLKRLSQAVADGDPIYAIIRGSAVNNDGQTSGYLATPGGAGQEEMLRKAYANAGVEPTAVQYIEAHGTGTVAGDHVEVGALGAVLGVERPMGEVCKVGSIKTNFGHTEGAAGIAGLIKVALSLHHQMLPASLHFHQPNPKIAWDDLRMSVNASLIPWPEHTGPALAGVNSFGIAGTNAHVVLQEAPVDANTGYTQGDESADPALLFPFSAQTPDALRQLAKAYQQIPASSNLLDVAHTLSNHRVHHGERLAVVAQNHGELMDKLKAFVDDERRRGLVSTGSSSLAEQRIVFVFSGHGAQWAGMGRQLLASEPVFAEMMGRCREAMRPITDWDLMDEIQSGVNIEVMSIVQPMVFAVQVSLVALWRSWGIEPSAIIGHSMGEISGAYAAGILTLEEAALAICRRSKLMDQLSGTGGMAVVELTPTEAAAEIVGYEDRLSIAVINGPRSIVLSGDSDALEEVLSKLRAREIFCRTVKVDVPAHSPHMETIRPELVSDLKHVRPQAGHVAVYSTVTGNILPGTAFDDVYWGENLRQPVRFADAVRQALTDGYTTFIEIGPHPLLMMAVEHGMNAVGAKGGLTLPSMRRNEDQRTVMLEVLGTLYTAGHPVNWGVVHQSGAVVRLPTYPWQREHFWAAAADLKSVSQRSSQRRDGSAGHPLLGQYFESHTGTHFWEADIELAAFPYLAHHQLKGKILFPAAGYTELALAAAVEVFGVGTHQLEAVSFQEALFLSDDASRTMQVVVTPEGTDRAKFECFSRPMGSDQEWTLHAAGQIRALVTETSAEFHAPQVLQAQLPDSISGDAHYVAMNRRQLQYGASFRGISVLQKAEADVLAELRLTEGTNWARYQIHPTLLDACFQALLETFSNDIALDDTYVPISLQQLALYQQPEIEGGLWAYAQRTGEGEILEGEIWLLNATGEVILKADGLRMQRLARSTDSLGELLYDLQWELVEPLPTVSTPATSGNWLVLSDQQGTGDVLAARLSGLGEKVVVVTAGNEYAATSDGHHIDPTNPEDYVRLFTEVPLEWRGVVHLWSLDAHQQAETLEGLRNSEVLGAASALYLTQAIATSKQTPNLWLVTRNAQAVTADSAPDIRQAALWGLGAVIANEHPELHPSLIDVGEGQDVESLVRVFFSGKLLDAAALRGEQVYMRRLRHAELQESVRYEPRLATGNEQPYKAVVTTPGMLDGLTVCELGRTAPAAGQVEIEVRATGLNFMNVLSALGVYPGYPNGVGPLGIECAGTITRVGEGVTDWQVGDAVVGVAFDSLASHALTDARLLAAKPEQMTFEQASTIPIVFLTAYYALHRLGRIEQGERVLIHAAAGGVGLAAIQLARLAGAEVFATAGTPEKRAYLHDLGIEHVLDSRTLDFADDLLKITGDGVDIVLNSLAGEAIPRGLSVLRGYGRFLELGKRDVYQNRQIGLLPFQNNLSYFMIDLDKMMRERPAQVGAMFQEIMALMAEGQLEPLPLTAFPINEVADAFRYMAQAKHIGKVVVSIPVEPVMVETRVGAMVRGDGSYLISGGVGGLGLTVARWLAEQGAGQIILTGRSLPSPEAQSAISQIEAAGTPVWFAQGDVTQPEAVQSIIAKVQRDMQPLRGVIHAAGILDDSLALQMSPEQFRGAVSPKMDGGWNLHIATVDCPLDFFVAFSSVTALLGIPGQSNYAAGNAFLDALMQYRQAHGQPALSINWGPWSDIGLAAAEANRGERLASRGLGSITPEQGIALLERLLPLPNAQVAVMPFDANAWSQVYSPAAKSSLLVDLLKKTDMTTVVGESTSQPEDLRALLLATEAGSPRRNLLENHIREQVARVLGLSAARIDVQKPLRNLGIDSLMTLELRNRLEASVKLPLSATLVFNYPTVALLTGHLAEKMDISLEAAQADAAAVATAQNAEMFDNLSQDEVESLLAEELDMLDDLLKGT